jgi:hypothetical protein
VHKSTRCSAHCTIYPIEVLASPVPILHQQTPENAQGKGGRRLRRAQVAKRGRWWGEIANFTNNAINKQNRSSLPITKPKSPRVLRAWAFFRPTRNRKHRHFPGAGDTIQIEKAGKQEGEVPSPASPRPPGPPGSAPTRAGRPRAAGTFRPSRRRRPSPRSGANFQPAPLGAPPRRGPDPMLPSTCPLA